MRAVLSVLCCSLVFAAASGCKEDGSGTTDAQLPSLDGGGEDPCNPEPNAWALQPLAEDVLTSDTVGEEVNFFGVWGASRDAIWVVGSQGAVVYFDGEQWVRQQTPIDVQLNSVWGTSASDVWACGYDGSVIHYDGVEWRDRSPPDAVFTDDAGQISRRNLWGIWAVGANDTTEAAFAVGDRGTVVAWSGGSWTAVDSTVEEDLAAVWGASAEDVFTVGDFGTVVRGSATAMAQVATGVPDGLRAVFGRSANDVLAAGVGGQVLYFDGSQWCEVSGAPKIPLRGIWGPPGDRSKTYFVGWDGAVARLVGSPACGDAEFYTFGCLTDQRLESIWGTMVDAPPPDGGTVGDGGVPQVPAIWGVGVSGTLITGP